MKCVLLLLVTILLSVESRSQSKLGIVKGVVTDSTSNKSMAGASVSVIRLKDSPHVASIITSDSGYFEINALDTGSYHLKVSYQGFEPGVVSFSITATAVVVDLGILKIHKAYETLAEVIVSDKTPVRIKGDTVAYNTDAFTTRPNATVGELLKKLPGVQVDRSGVVKTQGEEVRKIYVDGKEYFGDDPRLATMNLTADMVDQVQVFDDKSEQAKFNGIDDGSRNKAVNLRLKKEKKTNVSGKLRVGFGPNGEYNSGIRLNYFKGASRLSLVAGTNNINASEYGGPGFAEPGNRNNGITKVSSAGINYNDTWSRKLDANSSYIWRQANTSNSRNILRQTFLPGSMIKTNRQTDINNMNLNHRLNQKFVYTIDSLNSIIYTPVLVIQRGRLTTIDSLTDFISDSAGAYKGSESRTSNILNTESFHWSNNLIWRKRFKQAGRTFSANLYSTWNNNEQNGFNRINSEFYSRGGTPYKVRKVDNKIRNSIGAANYTLTLSYTEPISKYSIIEVSYSHHKNRSNSERNAYSYDFGTKEYSQLDDTLTNHFQQMLKYNRLGVSFNQKRKVYNYQLGLAVQKSDLSADNLSSKRNVGQNYTNVIPTLRFNYQLAKNKSLRMNYVGRNNPPTILQLQDIPELSNYPYIRRGNPDLRQEFIHNIMLSYNSFNTNTFRNMFISVFYYATQNKIVNALHLQGGEQILKPVNVKGTNSIRTAFTYSLPVSKSNGGHFSTTTRIGYNQNPGVINMVENIAKNFQVTQELNISYTHKENLDINLQGGLTFNSVNYSIQKQQNRSFFTHNYSFDLSYFLPRNLIFSSILDYTAFSGLEAGVGEKYIMWNSSLGLQIFKKKHGEITLSVNNILNQENNILRTVYDNVIEDIQNITQGRFFLVTFSYHFSKPLRRAKS